MEKIRGNAKKITAFLMAAVLLFSIASFAVAAANDYIVNAENDSLVCKYKGEVQKNCYLFIICENDEYNVVLMYNDNAKLYYFNDSGKGKAFTGVCGGKYYNAGKLAVSNSETFKVYSGKLYKVTQNGSATVYKKDTSKSGNYYKTVDGICYSVSYKNGSAKEFTGMYKEKCYTCGKPANGWFKLENKTYYCTAGVPAKGIKKIDGKVYYFNDNGTRSGKSGWRTVNGKKYYFDKTVAKTGWAIIKGNCYYFNANARMEKDKKVNGIKLAKNGKATGPIKKLVPLHAKLLVADITKPSQSKSKKLKICFDYVMKTYKSNGNPRIPHYTKEDWIYVYANDMFGDRGGGNCFSYAAAFAFLAKECGYSKVYACNSGGHGWVEINNKVYDPEQYKDVGKKIYGLDYSDSRISNYKKAISDYKTNSWKRVRIP